MYTPTFHREEDLARIHALMRDYSFAVLVTSGSADIEATHLPIVFDPEGGPHGTLRGHMARANDQWRRFGLGVEALVIFQGPHTYISPRWYVPEPPGLPSWNYTAVHAYGEPRVLEDVADQRAVLEELAAKYEAAFPQPWRMTDEPEQYVAGRSQHIVAFDMRITRLEGKAKLGQNKTAEDRVGVIAGLRGLGEPGGVAVAALMEERERGDR